MQKCVCQSCAYVFLILYLVFLDKQDVLSFVTSASQKPLEDPFESDIEGEIFDLTALESEEEDNTSQSDTSTAQLDSVHPFDDL